MQISDEHLSILINILDYLEMWIFSLLFLISEP